MSLKSSMIVILAAAMLGLAVSQPTTLATRYEGYSYVSNVIGYVNMTLDFCDIRAAIASSNFTAALDIYSTGKNSFSGLSRRSFYRFATITPPTGVVEPLHDALAMGRNATWLDTLIRDAAAKKNGPLFLGLLQVATLKYALHEIDEAHAKVAAYLQDKVNNVLLIDDASGAPHSVDEAFALWAGGSTRACATLSGWAARLGSELDASFLGRSHVNAAMTLGLNELLASARAGDQTSYNTTRYAMQLSLTVLGLQGVIASSYRLQAATGCKRPASEIAEAQALITVHWTYLQPLLVARKVPSATIAQLQAALTNSKPNYSKTTAPAVKSVASALGVRVAEIGVPNFDVVAAGWKCASSVMARRMAA